MVNGKKKTGSTQARHQQSPCLPPPGGRFPVIRFRAGLAWLCSSLWDFLRELSGEAAFERYRDAACASFVSSASSALFYIEYLEQKYSRPSRCC
jgi:hypothetical protein